MKKTIFSLATLFISYSAWGAPLWLRDATISPDGSKIAFTYKGDIYTVSPKGGEAKRLTAQPSYETEPKWSPDGKMIAFSSDRNGGQDIYVMSADGGAAKRLTFNSVKETVEAFSPDGKYVYFSAAIQDPATSAAFPTARLTEVYKVPVEGGRIEQVLGTPAQKINFIGNDGSFLYQDLKGFEDEWRKHHTSSVTRDIWMYNAKNGSHKNLTARPGEDRDPVLSPDGKTVYILSERDGKTFNVYSFPIDKPSAAKQESQFTTHPVRFLSQSKNGLLAYTYDGELYTQTPGQKPVKVNVNITMDDENPLKALNVATSQGATASPDGKMVAFTNRGNIFVTSVEYNTTKQITDTPAAESQISWAPDNRTIAYTSERDGHANIYTATISRKEDLNFPNATVIEEKPLFDSKDGIERSYPEYSPDGKEIAFVQDRRKLMVMNLESKKTRQITDGSTHPESGGGFSYSWSPDGKWITLEHTGNGHEPYSDVAIVNTTGTPVVTNITQSSYFDENPVWVMDGNAILFLSDRYGMRSQASWGSQLDAMLVFMNQDAYDKFRLSKEDYELRKELEKQQKKDKEKTDDKKSDKKADKKQNKEAADSADKDIKVELDGIRDRIVRLTPASTDIADAIINKDGDKLYYIARGNGQNAIWKVDLYKHDLNQVATLPSAAGFQPDAKGANIFVLGPRILRKMAVSSEKLTPITFSAQQFIDPAAEREYMFNYVQQEVANRFYEKKYHGVDWNAMTKAYRKFLPHINNNYDFAEMLSELLGELNASHTGSRYSPYGGMEPTASLGLLYDWTYNGKGLKVAEVVEKGPFDHANTSVKPGVVIEKIGGKAIDDNADYTTLFNNLAGKKTLISFYDPANGKRWEEVALPISNADMNNLLYERWIKQRAADVDRLSGGRLGYVHIKSMDDASYRNIYTDLFGKYVNKDGIVIDTRWNGGGRLHEDIEVLFSGKKYLTQVIRGVDVCDMPSRRWNKPSIMLQCEANYSNAHGTPWVYKTMGLGKLVGMPVPGTMTSVNWIGLQDPTLLFGVPVIGYRTAQGNYLENSQLEPDILVANDPATIVKGEDLQLKKAVEELMKELPKK